MEKPSRNVLSLILLLGAATAPAAETSGTVTASAPYELRDGRVYFPGWDDRPGTGSRVMLRLDQTAFPGEKVYRERILPGAKPALSTPFEIPTTATTIQIAARSLQTEHVFPRIRISLVAERKEHLLFENYWASLSIEKKSFPLPTEVRGKATQLRFHFLNPGTGDDYRTFFFAFATFHP